jgi:GTPase SAR1 family protein
MAGMVFFDISNPATISDVPYWVERFRSAGKAALPIVLIGTKLDLASPDSEKVALEVAQQTVEQLKLSFYMPTSSKTNVNVSEVFERLMAMLVRKAVGYSYASTREIHVSS